MSIAKEMGWGGGAFLWWLTVSLQLQLSFGSKGVILCASALKTHVHLCLEGGLMNRCCADRVCVCVWGQLCSPARLHGVAFVGVCAPSSSTSVYICVHAYDTLYSNGLILGTCGLRCLMCIPGTRADLMSRLWWACQNRGLRIMPQASSSV